MFPLDEFSRGGRPVERDDDSDDVNETTDQRATHDTACEPVSDTDEEQKVPDGDLGRVETGGETADEPGTPMSELLYDDEPT